MSVRQITIASILIIILAPVGFFFYWHYTHRYIPPPPRPVVDVIVKPGWNLRQIAEDWKAKGLIKSEQEFFYNFGMPPSVGAHGVAPAADWQFLATNTLRELLVGKPGGVSYEGYLLPETHTVYVDGGLEEIAYKFFHQLDKSITPEMRTEITRQGKSFFEILTMASIVEKEAAGADMAMVADIFWRRYERNWALQSCATVNYITGKNTPAVSAVDRAIDSPYNTYKYLGLTPGPISNPSLKAIAATIYPTKNDYWYFMSDAEGNTHFAKTLDEHNVNVAKYLR
ncbi:MAG: hypothetical protein A3J93_01890 [Candidatus Magasanikbacteria bacterium RIFOXYC2_FULL_42_28]|uniref:Endolytic murein transglycosylase n=1 Tax=Candidatus Magasanikbacteria bacterium RIFOXYC2_FULL_42_28 TaxID=1798704 RepID=A0A1F6NYC2_9BACT|nr:MAG: hypothetical protein A3J93_01890 [Candidatus Magasanikbacteria bacterium RIFOXYC2_FULL_42_28]